MGQQWDITASTPQFCLPLTTLDSVILRVRAALDSPALLLPSTPSTPFSTSAPPSATLSTTAASQLPSAASAAAATAVSEVRVALQVGLTKLENALHEYFTTMLQVQRVGGKLHLLQPHTRASLADSQLHAAQQ